MEWAWWLGAALLLAVVEILSLDLVLIMFAGGALVAALLALLGAELWVQILGFGIASTLLLLALRPWLLRHLRERVPLVETNVSALVGRTAVVVADVTDRAGRVKLSGEAWTARTEDAEVLSVGEEVTVVRIMGATAVVARRAGTTRADGPRLTKPARPGDRLAGPTGDRTDEESAP